MINYFGLSSVDNFNFLVTGFKGLNSIVYLVGIHSIIFTYIPSFTNNVDILYNGIILYSNIKHFLENKYLYIKKKLYIFNIIDCKKYLFIEKNMIFNIFYKDIKSLLFINNNFLVYKDTIIGDVNYINNYVFYFEHPEHFIYEYCTFKFISINITLNGDKKYEDEKVRASVYLQG